MDALERYFNHLKQVFAGVAEEPGVLWNSTTLARKTLFPARPARD